MKLGGQNNLNQKPMNSTKKEDLDYISLKKAADYSESYSQDYLSLRARQGKLKAKKLGRNWVTTKKWVDEYISEINKYNTERKEEIRENGKTLPTLDNFKQPRTKKAISSIKTKFFLTPSIKLKKAAILCAVLFAFIAGAIVLRNQLPKVVGVVQRGSYEVATEVGKLAYKSSIEAKVLTRYVKEQFFRRKKEQTIENPNKPAKQVFEVLKGHDKEPKKGIVSYLSKPFKAIKNFGGLLIEGAKGVSQGLASGSKDLLTRFSLLLSDSPSRFAHSIEYAKDFMVGSYQMIEQNVKNEIKQEARIEEVRRVTAKFEEKGTNFKRDLVLGAEGIQMGLLASLSSYFQKGSTALFNGVKKTAGASKTLAFYAKDNVLKGVEFITYPWRKEESQIVNNIITEVKEEVTAIPVREIIREVPVIREIIREVVSLDNKVLADIVRDITAMKTWKDDIEELRELLKRVQPRTPYVSGSSAPVYITNNGIQVGGAAIFSSLVVSGLAGFTNLGVGDSTTLGSDDSDTLTVNASSDFIGPVTFTGVVTFVQGITFDDLTIGSLTIDEDGNIETTGTVTASSFISDSSDSTVRKSGEEVFRGTASIYRYDIPSQTSTTTYFRVSKTISVNPLALSPSVLPGSSRVYRLIIKYSDDIATTSSSTWRIYRPEAATTTETFTIVGRNESELVEGMPHITDVLSIPDTDFAIEMKVPQSTSSIRVFQVLLAAYDRVN